MAENPKPRTSTRAMGLIGSLVLLAVILTSIAMISRQQRAAARLEALSNMRPVGFAMMEFDQEFGSYPSDDTVQDVLDSTGTDLDLNGKNSNDYFRQLIAFGIKSEDIFYAKTPFTHKPDKDMTGDNALAPGEVGISYTYGLHSSSDPKTPLLLAPMKIGTHYASRGPYGGKAAVAFIDRSILPLDIDRRGRIRLPDGSFLLDPAQPYWHDRPVDLRHPARP